MKRTTKPLVPDEQLNTAVAELLELARMRGWDSRTRPGVVFTDSPMKPDISELLATGLRESLEDEFVPAVRSADGEIDGSEIEREIVKKALVGLKLSNLKVMARGLRVPISGAAEEVAERIARAYGWDGAEVAQLVLQHEEEPTAERGRTSRIFALRRAPQLDSVARQIARMEGRYVRVGVARWFVFEATIARNNSASPTLEIHGSYRAYRAAVDDVSGSPALQALPETHATRILIDKGSTIVVHDTIAQAARAASRALELAADTNLLGFVPFAGRMSRAAGSSIDSTSEFLLDLLYNRLDRAGFTEKDLTIARFRTSDDDDDASSDVTRPALRAVRFEGRHLLDSADACRLLISRRRSLVEVALHASVAIAGEDIRVPMKISLDNDHVVVSTGLGNRPELSPAAHDRLVGAVRAEMESGVADEASIELLVEKIRARAAAGATPTAATMLSDS